MEKQDSEKWRGAEVRLRLRWQDASDLPTLYANQVYISHAGGEFYVIFGEVQQPVLVNLTPEELQKIAEVEVKPVVKLVFTPETMISIAEAIADNIRKFQQRQEGRKEDEA